MNESTVARALTRVITLLGLLELGDHLLKAVGPDNFGAFCLVLDKLVDLLCFVDTNLDPVLIHVEDEDFLIFLTLF